MFTLFLSLYSTISSVSPEVKSNAQKRSTFHLIAHKVLDSQWKERYFWMVPEPLVQQFLKKSWGSGDENAVKMADGGKRFHPVYFNGKRLLDFSNLRVKDKSKVRKKSLRSSTRRRAEDIPDDGGVNVVTDDEQDDHDREVHVGDGMREPLCPAGDAFSEDQGTSIVGQSIIEEYVLLLCCYEGVTMIDHRRFCLPQYSSSQHKLMVGIWFYEHHVFRSSGS